MYSGVDAAAGDGIVAQILRGPARVDDQNDIPSLDLAIISEQSM